MIRIVFSGVPQGKGRPRFSRRSGHAYTPAKTRSYEGSLAYFAVQAMRGQALLEGPLMVYVRATFPVPASWSAKRKAGATYPIVKPDVDNILKLLDALNAIVWHDDKQIVSAMIEKRYGPVPQLEIEVSCASAAG